ncbi:hypothetical protein BLNAU_12842 [Blattamonas nauphoetae]|uniref:Uncharacterized protein n=1 Tax=Blattamonas nauphoetae TaxID=2049346 RepID=A0ABQ9XIN4_9EUKA|nr:hypothetical protein BLNAU_12842 [Blattamonas nauphoetae]
MIHFLAPVLFGNEPPFTHLPIHPIPSTISPTHNLNSRHFHSEPETVANGYNTSSNSPIPPDDVVVTSRVSVFELRLVQQVSALTPLLSPTLPIVETGWSISIDRALSGKLFTSLTIPVCPSTHFPSDPITPDSLCFSLLSN